ncbi:hypothetical protein HYFRA_00002854 [Hymenoscyphus fraxineus]|uniref:Mitochondrial glycine transporter n=1 Tax=Hymenoscyphus fraxineus TaxID=746836 RepID=A0A9N9PP37_9HELO|nr:hypothetical protein HYFRA_00002854 [Hymenoscyphus fraxineus]
MPKDVGSSFLSHASSGGASGLVSAVILQPADLLKTRVQQSGHSSLRATVIHIWRTSPSVLSFWRGTLPSGLRTGAGTAIYFSVLNDLRTAVARSNILVPGVLLDPNARTNYSSSLPKLSNLGNLTTGAVARTFAGFLTMPMTVMKVRYESNLYTYTSLWGASRDIFKTQGLRGFWSGFGATAWRDAPYAGLQILFYEQSKDRLSRLAQKTALPGEIAKGMKVSTSAGINFTSGIVAAGLATAITNPFDAIKTRIQLEPLKYRNILQAGRVMLKREGITSLFDGLGLRMGRKALSSAFVWTLYEDLIRRTEMAWK